MRLVIAHPNVEAASLERLSNSPDPYVRGIASNRGAPDDARRLAADRVRRGDYRAY